MDLGRRLWVWKWAWTLCQGTLGSWVPQHGVKGKGYGSVWMVALEKGCQWRVGVGLQDKPQAPVSGPGGEGWVRPSVLRWYSASGLKKPMLVFVFGEGNGSPLQYSCLENPVDGGAWWAAVRGVAQSWTRLK